MGTRRRKSTRNERDRRQRRDADIPEMKSVRKKKQVNDEGFVTAKEVQQMVTPLIKKIDTVLGTVQARNETVKTRGDDITDAELHRINKAQHEDAQAINKKNRAIPLVGAEKLNEDYLFKNIHQGMSREQVSTEFQKVLSAPTDSSALKEVQIEMDKMKIRCGILGIKPSQSKYYDRYKSVLDKTGITKVLTTATASGLSDADFIPEGWSMELLSYYYQMIELPSAFNSFPMPHNPFTYPILGRPTAKRRAVPTASNRGVAANEKTATDPTNNKITFEAEKIIARVDLYDDLVEDAVEMLLDDLMRKHIPEAMAQGVENAIVNGDTAGTHQDTGSNDADNVAKCWDGLRKIAIERSATYSVEASSGVLDFGDFSRVLEKGGHYLLKPSECGWVLPNSVYYKTLRMDEVETLDKYNPPANMNGVVAYILGRPVFTSAEYPETLDENGVVSATAANNIHTGFTAFNHALFMMGERREETVKQMYDNLTEFYYISSDCRKDFQAMENLRAGFTPCASAINITTAS